jgi:conjugal transfer pilus assembly protein TraV
MRHHRSPAIGCISAVLLAIVMGTAGCGTVGEKEFACPGRPPGVHCMSATEVYKATERSDRVEVTADHALGQDPNAAKKKKTRRRQPESSPDSQSIDAPGSASTHNPNLLLTATQLPAIDKPLPIRTPAQVMRVWMAPWEDAKGILHAGGYSFIEIEARRWMLGETSTDSEPVRFFSIQTPARDSTGRDAKESGGKGTTAPNNRSGASERAKKTSASTLPRGDSK